MNLRDVLISNIAALPRPPRTEPFEDALARLFANYLDLARQVDADDDASKIVRRAVPDIERLCASIFRVLDLSLRGQPSRARDELDKAIKDVTPHIERLVSVPIEGDKFGVAYRVRLCGVDAGLARSGLFHIPYDQRHRVGPQRFSVLGVPMLYLGSTLYVCWEELGRPPFRGLWMAAFRLRKGKTLKLLNLAYRPGLWAMLLDQAGYPAAVTELARIAASYAVLWPLIAASTHQVPPGDAAFVIEYVVPQLLMSWVAETNTFDGIRYFSSIHRMPPAATWAIINYALPAQDIQPSGYSPRLADLFELTEPVEWTFSDAVGTLVTPLYHGRISAVLKLAEGQGVPYEGTVFARMEGTLEQVPFAPLA